MAPESNNKPSEELRRIIESAQRLGVGINEEEAIHWLTAIAAGSSDEISMDVHSGVFGNRVAMLDFSPEQLSYYRGVAKVVGFNDEPGRVETALALSGSAAQSKIQSFPGDCDFFERVNIIANTQPEACEILSEIMRKKALDTLRGPTYQLIEVKFGSYPVDLLREEILYKSGAPIAWTANDIQSGKIGASLPDGTPTSVQWDDVKMSPGWCKLDWVIADPVRSQLANASNMLDVTWEAPDGTITPLDGYLDPYFQEIYLEASSVPIFSKLAKHVSADALESYVMQLEKEVDKYLTKDLNYGKAAKRMYNIFRLTGRYEDAAFLRELFDEPATILYQVWSLVRTIDDCTDPGSSISLDYVLSQADQLIINSVQALEGEQEKEIVRRLLRLRDTLTRQDTGQALTIEAEAARAEVINLVNNFFYERLTSLPTIKSYIDEKQGKPAENP